ncbi:MAG: tRNA 2-thiocytidine biosynthesis protein TtcA [Chloroflexi bacterium ADurb.Bin360]|nr:MAG: tRNA 2-thiocytidine biosynthesis protein TtcA [Chloroflexi bacterium ADurb.Bin360]
MATPESIAHYLMRSVRRAVREFALITPGDRIAVGVSGGKDSRVLLELLARGEALSGNGNYELVAIHVETASAGLPDQRPALETWFQTLNIPFEITSLELPATESLPLDCFRCTQLRRKALFRAAVRHGCNKVAYGHHADDAAITTLLSILHKGQIESLAPYREYFGGQLTLIRPLIYVTEAEIRRYARACGWEFPPELECPRKDDARRDKVERFLATFNRREREQIRANLIRLGTARGEETYGKP